MILTNLIPGASTAKWVGIALLLAGVFAGGWTVNGWRLGRQIQADKTAAAKLQAMQAQQDNAGLAKSMQEAYGQAVKDNALNAASAAKQVQIQTVYRTITKEVHDAKITECSNVGPDFVRIYNAAVAGVRAAAAQGTPAAGHATGP